jgi:hypothetical protein
MEGPMKPPIGHIVTLPFSQTVLDFKGKPFQVPITQNFKESLILLSALAINLERKDAEQKMWVFLRSHMISGQLN